MAVVPLHSDELRKIQNLFKTPSKLAHAASKEANAIYGQRRSACLCAIHFQMHYGKKIHLLSHLRDYYMSMGSVTFFEAFKRMRRKPYCCTKIPTPLRTPQGSYFVAFM